ncbi:flagellar basal body-associated FliL family protein [Methylibium sp.]|uniref:flagellar basal body-associated FliL family protein n=1 Tax=Methylibium sp. TaxID=2067992 RepID=UPI00183E5D3E|nr:flagellar basal body-associated FliL family protein [Methylibium sp.]MBA3591896.1 flagellar basal body-associated FliL family protein [Methylibium sp.]
MSAAAAEAAPVSASKPRRKLSKKLLMILAIVGVLLAGGAAATVFVLKKKAALAAALAGEDDALPADEALALQDQGRRDPSKPPTFLPLDPFVVNLADREQERYAQIGITLQIDNAAVAEQLKAYMPAIRNGVLMILAHKSSAELLERAGKEQLAAEIMRESVRPLGIEVAPAAPVAGRPRVPAVHNPVEKVHFSSFIIQ